MTCTPSSKKVASVACFEWVTLTLEPLRHLDEALETPKKSRKSLDFHQHHRVFMRFQVKELIHGFFRWLFNVARMTQMQL